MTHLKPVNRKAVRIEEATAPDVVALQHTGLPLLPHFPIGCSLVFSPGWETDSAGGTDADDTVTPSGTRPVRLPHRLLLAGPSTGPVEPRARLDGEMRGRTKGLAQNRSHLPVSKVQYA